MAILGAVLAFLAVASRAETPRLPDLHRIADSATSYPFLAAAHQQRPLDLARLGYVEEEFLVSGRARVFDWPQLQAGTPQVLGEGTYTTRILIRRPRDATRFSGTVVVEPLNPSAPTDLPIMWGESHEHFIAQGNAWVGITIKPNTIKALKVFDPQRYADVAMAAPAGAPRCATGQINPSSQPTTPADETGLAWDMLAQIGALLKTDSPTNPLGRAAQRLYVTGQSQTAGYARTFATVFHRNTQGPDGKPLFDAYLYSGSPPWQVPLNQCRADLAASDPRLITPPVGVPVVELFAQGDIGTNVATRRPDADTPNDRFRRYEIAGAPHVDPWEELSFASTADVQRATKGAPAPSDDGCVPKDVQPSDFPTRVVFNAAWRNLDQWVRQGVAPPHAPLLQLKPAKAGAFNPESAFVTDDFGNAKGGVRTPTIDVPTARWIGAKTGGFRCMFEGYKYPFDAARLAQLYPSPGDYVGKVRRSVQQLVRDRWLLEADGAALVREAEQRR
jgi:hypothetical protein